MSWWRLLALTLLAPIVLPVGLLVMGVLSVFGLGAGILQFWKERSFARRMHRCGRWLTKSEFQQLQSAGRGTLLIESPTLGWNVTRAWWTPDELARRATCERPDEDAYRAAMAERRCTPWDRWCWDEYVSPETGRAMLVRVWNGAALERRVPKAPGGPEIERTWSALVAIEESCAQSDRKSE